MAKDDDTGTLSEAERRRRSKEAASRLPMQRQNNLLSKILRGERKINKGPE